MAEYKSSTEENKCIFCEIAKGTFPPLGNGLIYEDEHFMARLSPFPNTL
jgi:diadenosine tetraphosphate (Ap4A) HIT family hydrolase